VDGAPESTAASIRAAPEKEGEERREYLEFRLPLNKGRAHLFYILALFKKNSHLDL
jgi:hypothetical protein